MRKYHIIYITTNIVTNEYYIGMHSTHAPLRDGYFGSGVRLKESIQKHGTENHTCDIIEYCDTRDVLYKRESIIVNRDVLSDPLCLNLRVGGGKNGFTITKEQQKENHRRSIIAQRLLSENNIEWKEQRSRRLTRALKLSYAEGRRQSTTKPHVVGEFKHSEDTKKKLSIAKKGQTMGASNPSFGTCWIYSIDLKQNKRINKDDLPQYIIDGWIKGRKLVYYKNRK